MTLLCSKPSVSHFTLKNPWGLTLTPASLTLSPVVLPGQSPGYVLDTSGPLLPLVSAHFAPAVPSLTYSSPHICIAPLSLLTSLQSFFFFFFLFFLGCTLGIWKFPGWGRIRAASLHHSHSHTGSKPITGDLRCSLQQRQILNPPREARDQNLILMDISQVLNPLNHNWNSFSSILTHVPFSVRLSPATSLTF